MRLAAARSHAWLTGQSSQQKQTRIACRHHLNSSALFLFLGESLLGLGMREPIAFSMFYMYMHRLVQGMMPCVFFSVTSELGLHQLGENFNDTAAPCSDTYG
jgi:hypothetical protein